MTRSQIVKSLMETLNGEDIVVASTGLISREVFRYDRPMNFYMMGSMGNAYAIGIGLAMHLKNRVYVISGDGACLMGLGSLVTGKRLRLSNLFHFIIDNNAHESTGRQETASKFADFSKIGHNTIVYEAMPDETVPPRITMKPYEITERFKIAVESLGHKQFECQVS